ncbi:MAG: nucleotidyltransferase domain-containing protein [Candidatus Poribacteria bacterium]|nr:nucleotidyltransferase domain-containing protein [Candidatus Poribacteria bacterium]
MKYGLSQQTLQKIHDVFVQYPQIEEVVLYGSRARGDYKNGSDIDLTLHGGDSLTHTILSKIANDLDDQLLPYTIELSIFKNIRNPDMVEQIERVGVVFYKK